MTNQRELLPELLIVWFSRTGGSEAMARAAADAAEEAVQGEAFSVRLLNARQATADDLLSAKAYIFVCPENLAAMAGGMKEFFDTTYYAVLGRIEGRSYAAMVCAGSDGTSALSQIERIATGWRLRQVTDGLIINTAAQTPEAILAPKTLSEDDLDRCRTIGATLAAGTVMGVF